jgi:YD repeat-containing protein
VHPKSFGRLAADYTDPYSVTDTQLASYADYYFRYDSQQRVTMEVAQGEGCSLCSAGLGTYTFSYTTSSNTDSVNKWKVKTTETLPDGNQNIVYTNAYGEVMLKVLKDVTTGQQWCTFYQYDLQGRAVIKAEPSAVSGYNDTYADLMHWTGSNYEFLRDTQGLITLYGYASTTTATSSAPGNVAGRLLYTAIVRGDTTTPVLQEVYRYMQRTAGGVTVTPVAMDTVFRNPTTTGPGRQPQTTYYSYTWFSGTTKAESVTVTGHMAPAAQNGPVRPPVTTTYFDRYGEPIWSKDPDGYLSYTTYDVATGTVTKQIADVNTSQTSDFLGLPSGWSNPSGGGLHLITQNEVDALGRVTKLTDPQGNVTYTVFNDANHEVRVYDGWDSGTNLPTGPTGLSREDRAHGYVEILTMSATPAVTSGRPTGAESVSGLQTLSRDYTNIAGQTVRRDDYFDLSGVTYSTDAYIGTAGTNFYSTQFAYDSRGRPNRTITPTGTIYRTVYDTPSRVASVWIGTDDTPTSGYWSPTNTAGTDLVKVTENEYDGGGIGNGTLTKTTHYPGGTAAPRVTQNYYDWRDRLVATKEGVETTESTSVNRPIWYYDYDNLNEVTSVERYDGDGVTVSDANSDGVPDRPSSGILRAKATNEYDDLGRVFRTRTYSVDPSTGAVSANSLATSFWYDLRDNLIKTAAPGGLVTKVQYDGVGRPVKTFISDGGGDLATGTIGTWDDALNVTGDTVLEQAETQYDANGNVILVTTRQRFHDATGTALLGDPSSTSQPKARVYYAGYYYDLGDRLTSSVNVGTNGGTIWTRPSSAPSRSDSVLITDFGYNAAGWLQTATDPRNIASKTFYDSLGRTTKTIEAYTDGVVTATTNRTTEFTYDGLDHLLTYTARVVGGGGQTTQYVYGVSPSDGSTVTSNDLLREVHHPDNSTGSPNAAEFDF